MKQMNIVQVDEDESSRHSQNLQSVLAEVLLHLPDGRLREPGKTALTEAEQAWVVEVASLASGTMALPQGPGAEYDTAADADAAGDRADMGNRPRTFRRFIGDFLTFFLIRPAAIEQRAETFVYVPVSSGPCGDCFSLADSFRADAAPKAASGEGADPI